MFEKRRVPAEKSKSVVGEKDKRSRKGRKADASRRRMATRTKVVLAVVAILVYSSDALPSTCLGSHKPVLKTLAKCQPGTPVVVAQHKRQQQAMGDEAPAAGCQLQRLRGGDAPADMAYVVSNTSPKSPTKSRARAATPPPFSPVVGRSMKAKSQALSDFVDSPTGRAASPFAPQTPAGIASTPHRGWPARFRRELELLKGAMAEYEESQLNALSALGAEKEKSKLLADEKTKVTKEMERKLRDMESEKANLESRAFETETKLEALAKGGEGLPTIEALKKEKEELARQADEAMAQLKELRTELELARERGAKEGVIEGGVSSLEEQSLRVKEVQLQVQRVEQAKAEFETRAKAAADEAHNLKISLASAESARASAVGKLDEASCRVDELKERVEAAKRERMLVEEQSERAIGAMRLNMKRSQALQQAQAERIMLLEQQQQGLRREKEQAEAAVAEIRSQMVEASKSKAKAESDLKRSELSYKMVVEQLRGAEKSARASTSEASSLVKEWRERGGKLEEANNLLKERSDKAEAEASALQARLRDAEDRYGRVAWSLEEIEGRVTAAEKERDELRAKVEQAERDSAKAVDSRESDFREMERRVAESSAQLTAVKDELASAITERNSLRQNLAISDAAAKRVDSEAGARLAAAEKEVESLKKLEAEREKAHCAMVGQLEEAVSDAKAQVVRLEDHVLALNTKHASEIRNVRKQLEESSAAIAEATDRVTELEGANHDLKLSNAVATGHAEELTNRAAASQASMLRANANMLTSQDCSRVYNAKLQDLKRRLADADRQRDVWHERASAAEAKASDLSSRMKEDSERRAGDSSAISDLSLRLSATQADHKILTQRAASADRKVLELSDELERAQAEVLRAEGRADAAEAQCRALEVLVAEGKAENAALKAAIVELEATLSEHKVGTEEAEAAAKELRKELACLRQSSVEGKLSREREVAELKAALSELENGKGALRAQVDAANGRLRDREEGLMRAQSKCAALENIKHVLVSQADKAEEEILRLKGLLEAQPGYEARIESLETLKSELQARLGPAEEQVMSLKKELKTAEDAKKAANEQLAALKKQGDKAAAELDGEIKSLRTQLEEAQNRNSKLEAEGKRIAEVGETAAKAAEEERSRVASLKGELNKAEAAHVQTEKRLGEERAKGLESARKLKAAQAELETASKVSSKQWSLIQAAGTQLKAEIAKNSNLIKENEALKTVSDKYQEMYSEYMEMRSERVQLEKQVRDMATSRSILSRKAAAADAIARRLRDNINMDVGL